VALVLIAPQVTQERLAVSAPLSFLLEAAEAALIRVTRFRLAMEALEEVLQQEVSILALQERPCLVPQLATMGATILVVSLTLQRAAEVLAQLVVMPPLL
jgi:hypothetical protein